MNDPRAHSRRHTMKSFLIVMLAVAALVPALVVAPASAATPGVRNDYPTILVPGYGGHLWAIYPIGVRLIEDGHDVRWFADFTTVESHQATAKRAAQHVKEVAATTGKVNLVCFSAGVLSCRWAMKYLGIQNLVDRVVMVAGGNGSYIFCVMPIEKGGDGCFYSLFARSIELGDDTPGPAEYTLITSFPQEAPFGTEYTPIPDGGICYKHIPYDGFKHPAEPFQPVYLDAISQTLEGTCPGEFVDKPITNKG